MQAPELVLLRPGDTSTPATGPSVPSFLKARRHAQPAPTRDAHSAPQVPPSSAAVAKAKLTTALAPSEDMISRISADASLLSLFDDPDVMAAVSEVASNPEAFAKHAHKPKVRAFYTAMSGIAADRLDEVASKEQPQPSQKHQPQQPSTRREASQPAPAPAAKKIVEL